MEKEIKDHLTEIFWLLLKEEKIIIPDIESIKNWEHVLKEWVADESMNLFVRKAGEIRGKKVDIIPDRSIIVTDNTPAHWVFKKMAFEKCRFTKSQIADLLSSNSFPVAFIRKKSEYETLKGNMIADNTIRLGDQGWKLAHIDRIALKRGKNNTVENYTSHHLIFLNLDNMYLIDKEFSGLAEVQFFNQIIRTYKKNQFFL